MPAAAVIRKGQTLFKVIGRKIYVGRKSKFNLNLKVSFLKSFKTTDFLEFSKRFWNFKRSGKMLWILKELQKLKQKPLVNWHWGIKAWVAKGIRYPCSPCREQWMCIIYLTITFCLGSTIAKLKLKGIDGSLHKQWSMWFKSTLRAKPYQFLNQWQVLHGCRQSVFWNVWLIPTNGQNFYVSILSIQTLKIF